MTYPPQQPGSPGYGQQPGQGGPYGPQPGGQYPPSGPQPGQGGPYGPQPGGQYPPYGPQQQGFGQPGFPQPGGGPPPPPQKKKTGLIVGIVAAAVIVLGGGTVAAVLLIPGNQDNNAAGGNNGEEKPVTPQEATNEFAGLFTKMLQSKGKEFDQTKAKKYICPSYLEQGRTTQDGLLADAAKHPDPNDPYWKGIETINYQPVNIQVNGKSGTFDVAYYYQGKKASTNTLTLTKQSGQWQVCGPPKPQ